MVVDSLRSTTDEKVDICNFADDNTLYSCAQFISEAIGNRYLWPENCFELVQRLTETAKSQFMVLSKSAVKYSTEIIDKKIFLFKSVKLLGLTIESYFDIYLQGFQQTKYSTGKITLKFVYPV